MRILFEPFDEVVVQRKNPQAEIVLRDAPLGVASQALGKAPVVQQLRDSAGERIQVRGVFQQQSADTMLDLVAYPTDGTGDDRLGLPHRLGHREAEALAKALLHDYRCMPLQGVDHRRVLLQVVHGECYELDALALFGAQPAPVDLDLLEDLGAFGVIGDTLDARARKHELRMIGARRVDRPDESVQDADGILESIPTRNLDHKGRIDRRRRALAQDLGAALDERHGAIRSRETARTVRRHAGNHSQMSQYAADRCVGHLLVLGRERIDGRRKNQTATVVQQVGKVGESRKDERVGLGEVGLEKRPSELVFRRTDIVTDVTAPNDPHSVTDQVRDQTGGLWIMQDGNVPRPDQRDQLAGVVVDHLLVHLTCLRIQIGPVTPLAVKRMVDTLGDAEEFRRATDHQPGRIHAQTPSVGQQAMEHLGHATPRGRAVDVPDRPTLEFASYVGREAANLLDMRFTDNFGERIGPLGRDRHFVDLRHVRTRHVKPFAALSNAAPAGWVPPLSAAYVERVLPVGMQMTAINEPKSSISLVCDLTLLP